MFQFPILITVIALAIYQGLSINVSKEREQKNIKAPATTGNPDFERAYRAHLNYMENLVIFLPLVWIGNIFFVNNLFYTIACFGWIIARTIFSYAYITNLPLKIKIVPSLIAVLSTLILLILGIISIFLK
jgi:uncharacterized MAPEG superfamily protein